MSVTVTVTVRRAEDMSDRDWAALTERVARALPDDAEVDESPEPRVAYYRWEFLDRLTTLELERLAHTAASFQPFAQVTVEW